MNSEESRSKIRTICLMVLTGAAGVFLVYWLRPVLLPLVVALMIVSGVSPLLEGLQKRLGVSKMVAAGITFMAGLALLVLVGSALWTSANELASHSGDYEKRFQSLVERVESNVPYVFWEGEPSEGQPAGQPGKPPASDTDSGAATDPPVPVPPADKEDGADENEAEDAAPAGSPPDDAGSADASSADATESPGKNAETHHENGSRALVSINKFLKNSVRDGVSTVSQALLQLVSTSVIVLIYVFFLLLGSPGKATQGAWRDIDKQIRSYLALKSIISLLTGLAFGGALWIAGVPMAVTFGVLAFLLNFIPNVGPVIAGLLPVPFVLLDPEGSILWMVSVISVSIGIQTVSGNVVEPKLMGNSSDLHPIVVLATLMFWGMMWGITGMFLATPITAAIKIVLERFESTRPLAAMLAGRWKMKQLEEESPTQSA